eukprot:4393251-Pleurochrysis_carterae.AAC.1
MGFFILIELASGGIFFRSENWRSWKPAWQCELWLAVVDATAARSCPVSTSDEGAHLLNLLGIFSSSA